MKKEEFNSLINRARETDLLEYFQKSGYTTEKHGDQYYVKEFPGLCIKPETNQWFYHYTNVGRTNNSIDCLTMVLDRPFNQAVYELTGEDISKMRSADYPKKQAPAYTSPPKEKNTEKEKKEISMPDHAPNMRRLFAYFCQKRKIPAAVVEELVHARLLYQSENNVTANVNGIEQNFKNSNVVFVHKNEKGETVGGEIQGINSFKRYKGIVSGTGNSAFTFMPVPSKDGKPDRAYIFESAIDLMSFYSFCNKKKLEGAVFISMAGLKPTVPKKLQEQGVKIISCVDNDDAGRKFEAENGFVRSESVKKILDEQGFKDWNELLVFKSDHTEIKLSLKDAENKIENTPKRRFV